MTSIPANISRVPNTLLSQAALANLTRTNAALFRVNTQLSSGLAVSRFSDDSVRAAAISVLDDWLERSRQRLRNTDHAEASLATLDTALGEAADLLLEAKGIASSQLNAGSGKEERAAQAQVVDSLIQGLYGLANREGPAGYIFGGSTPGTRPVEPFLGGYRYVGSGPGLFTDLGPGAGIPITLGPGVMGSTSARIAGSVDLDPDLTAQTRIADLRGARSLGISLGQLEFSFDGGPSATIDLAGGSGGGGGSAGSGGGGASTIQNVLDTLTAALRGYEQQHGVAILGPGGVSFSGGALTIDVLPGTPDPALQFAEVGSGVTARDLGLTGDPPLAFSASSATGLDLQPDLTWTTPISALAGLTGPLGSIRLKNAGQVRLIDLSGAQTLEDIRNAIQSAAIGARVQINADRTGIDVLNEIAGGPALSIEEVPGSNLTASRLGIRSFSGETRIEDLNHGRGVSIVHGVVDPVTGLADPALNADFTIDLGGGASFAVDLRPQDMGTIQSVIDRINQQAESQGFTVPAGFQALLSDDANGIVLRHGPGFSGPILVQAENNSTAAADLGLKGAPYDPATGSLLGADAATVRPDNIFATLIDLRDALQSDDTSGIAIAGEHLESLIDRLAQTRALVGGYANRVDSTRRSFEDQAVLNEKTRSELRDLDYTEAAVRLSLLQTQLQAGMHVTALSASRTLLDFLG